MQAKNIPLPSWKKVLIIASSGGGGLIQAANAKEQQLRLKYPQAHIIRKDLLRDWVAKWMGKVSIRLWNAAQKKGNVKALKLFCIGIAISDFFFAPYVFFKTLRTLFTEDVDHIIDTQPMCTGSIIKALRFFHWRKGRRVYLEKVLVDLPTSKATHYFRSIRNLSDSDRIYMKITSIYPFLKHGETSEEFWKTNCRLSEAQINYEPFYVRQSFCQYHKKPRLLEPCQVKVCIKNAEERKIIQKCIQKGSIEARWKKNAAEFLIGPEDLVFTILLGSQPAFEGSLNYVQNFIALAREYEHRAPNAHLFIFCGNHTRGEASLLKSVADLVQNTPKYPSFFSVVPLSFQDDTAIAPLFHRSDSTCTRSGGQTLMELMCVEPRHIWIHSEAKKKKKLTQEDLLGGIAGWEAANALYMQQMCGAKIVTPQSFVEEAREIFAAAEPIPNVFQNLEAQRD